MSLADDFVVKDMRVEGLQRISEGTVFNYLPINIGDTVDHIRISEAIRALYTQGLFDDRVAPALDLERSALIDKRPDPVPRSGQVGKAVGRSGEGHAQRFRGNRKARRRGVTAPVEARDRSTTTAAS